MEGKKILLVDDSATALMMETMILKAEPVELVTAKNGQQAVDLAARERPDLILLDVVMPVMDGFEACRRLRAIEGTSKTPIIMVTTRGEEQHVETGFECGCTDYVTKPINGLELLNKVRSCLTA
ncbi:MAG: response regulator [Acidobacteriota bacterium]